MIEQDIEALIDKSLAAFTYAHDIDIKCFKDHRIQPTPILLSMDTHGAEWKECYLITNHNKINDSSFRAAFDQSIGKFVREVTLENGIAHYL
jgi:hypothetical protein